MIPAALAAQVGTLLPGGSRSNPAPIEAAYSLGGGCIHNACQILSDGRPYFLKWNQKAHADNFRVEASGLDLLGAAGPLKVPRVLGHGGLEPEAAYAFLLLEFIPSGSGGKAFWEEFGRGLATMHKTTQAAQYGLIQDNYIGSLPQYNRQMTSWVDFFIAQRLGPQLKLANAEGLAGNGLLRAFETLYRRLPQLMPQEPPSLLHGDLWSGNFMRHQDGYPVLIDPAVYYGHREAELAFTRLFGGFRPAFYEAYQEAWPLQPGWEQRIDLFNLYPLMVHLNLFGRSYLPQIQQILNHYC